MSIKELQKSIHKDNVEAGWWDEKLKTETTRLASCFALMHMELSKSLEVIRKGGKISEEEVLKSIKSCFNLSNNDDNLIKIALMHSELSEATAYHLSGGRDDHLKERDGEEVEISDLVIRALDYAENKGYDIESAIKEKREYNKRRKDHSPEERNKKSGKQF